MVAYLYLGAHTNGNDPVNFSYGVPLISSFNPYHSDHSVPLVRNRNEQQAENAALTAPLSNLAVNRSLYPSAPAFYALDQDQGAILYLAGARPNSRDAFGIAVGDSVPYDASSLPLRYILAPNTPSATGVAFPVPVNAQVPEGAVYSKHETPTVDFRRLSYRVPSGSRAFFSPFVLPNAWKYANGKWDVDTSINPVWTDASFNDDKKKRSVTVSPGLSPSAFHGKTDLARVLLTTKSIGLDTNPILRGQTGTHNSDLVYALSFLRFN
jgi:hypothetical protein